MAEQLAHLFNANNPDMVFFFVYSRGGWGALE